MSEIRHLSEAAARRFLVVRHLLAPPRSLPAERESVLRVIDRIGTLQFDPLEVAGRNHDLILLARVAGYRREWTDHWLYEERRLYETYNKGLSIVPTAELPWYRLTWDRAQAHHEGATFDEHAPLVEEILDRIRRGGELLPRDLGPREAIEWYWRPTNQVRAILEALAESGRLGIARRDGNLRVYDLIERLLPADVLANHPPEREQRLHRLLSRYRANGLLAGGGQQELWSGMGPHDAAARADLRRELVEKAASWSLSVSRACGPSDSSSGRRSRSSTRQSASSKREPRPRVWRPVSHSWRPWTPSAGIGTCCVACSRSTTSGRSTSLLRNGDGATTCCRSCMATGWSGESNRGSTDGPERFGLSGCGGRPVSTPSRRMASWPRLPRPSRRTASSAECARSPCPERLATAHSSPRYEARSGADTEAKDAASEPRSAPRR